MFVPIEEVATRLHRLRNVINTAKLLAEVDELPQTHITCLNELTRQLNEMDAWFEAAYDTLEEEILQSDLCPKDVEF